MNGRGQHLRRFFDRATGTRTDSLMDRMSRPVHDLREHYEVVVVGSGYGGGIVAARLAAAGRSVCVLERGKELHPGQYPNTLRAAGRQVQAHLPQGRVGPRTAMIDVHVGPDITVVAGCGLGGTSLINANVALRANPAVFKDRRWPDELRGRRGVSELEPHYRAAEAMLGTNHYPDDWPELPKFTAFRRSAEAFGGAKVEPAPLNVTFKTGPNSVGVMQRACTLCGDCVSGCNYGAKNTVLMNYIPYAYQHGAQIFTEVEVLCLRKQDDGSWQVEFNDLTAKRRRFGPRTRVVSADVVVLGAGSLGSTEILLRSKAAGLSVSRRLGLSFTGNGDVLGLAFDTDAKTRAIGLGRRPSSAETAVGACINGMARITDGVNHKKDILIQEGAIPGALGPIVGPALGVASAIWGKDEKRGLPKAARRLRQFLGSLIGSRRGTASRSFPWLVMSIDNDMGRMSLVKDRLQISWPGVEDGEFIERDNAAIEAATRELRGTFIPSPMWATPVGNMLVTVQPLGGCDMGNHGEHGVVNHKGQVFSGSIGKDVHKGLYVADGSVVPSPLGSNPSLTISALAERIAAFLVDEMDGRPPTPPARRRPQPTVQGLRFSERMTGYFSAGVLDDYDKGFVRGRKQGSPVDFSITITYADVAALLRDHATPARISGTVRAPVLSDDAITVVGGVFKLFEHQSDRVETDHMVYELDLMTNANRRYKLKGFKVLRERGSLHAWPDSTTLFAQVLDDGGNVIGVGGLRISLTDFSRLLSTIEVTGESDPSLKRRYRVEFMRMFMGKFLNFYGGVLDEASSFPSVPTDVKVPLTRARPSKFREEPENWWYDSKQHRWKVGNVMGERLGDNAELQLFRFRGGDRGPIMLAPGFAMSATSYLADTTRISLAEYLYTKKYDVWLFDGRTGIQLPPAGEPYSLDDVAKEDWPRGVERVLDVTGKDSVQVFAHCTGSLTFQMAMLAGLQGVRSAVCSQVTALLNPGLQMRIKLTLPVEPLLDLLKIKSLTPDDRRTFRNMLLDVLLRAVPMKREERCGQALCRWINTIYGKTHRHAQLNDATHRALHAMFGVGALAPGKQFAKSMRKGYAVDQHGKNTYIPNAEGLAIPLLFLHGAENSFFLPKGSERTFDWLCEENGSSFYKREVLPGYAHLDTFLGKNSHIDVYPTILDHLEETATL